MDSRTPLPVNAVTASSGMLKVTVVHAPAATVRLGLGAVPFRLGTPTNSTVPLVPPLAPMAATVLVSRNAKPTFSALSVYMSNFTTCPK